MRFSGLLFICAVFSLSGIQATPLHTTDTLFSTVDLINPDSLLEAIEQSETALYIADNNRGNHPKQSKTHTEELMISEYSAPTPLDSLLLEGNPFFIDLVYMGKPQPMKAVGEPDVQEIYFGFKKNSFETFQFVTVPSKSIAQIIEELREKARSYINSHAVLLYAMRYDQLPDPNKVKSKTIEQVSLKDIKIVDNSKIVDLTKQQLTVKKEQLGPWRSSANSMLQFSQNMASDNWYQGGNSSMSVLGILNGQLNFDNKKGIQWENFAEWRMGFNAVFNDPRAKRALNTNDDVIRLNSKLGIRASDKFFYSTSVDFSTQLLNNYQNINSTTLKASFLSPVRLNVGVGMDLKYKRASFMLAPVSYKYIYVLETDPKIINPNMFGIKTGENKLSEIGSSFRSQYSYSPFKELQIDSRLTFYTNYEKVEIDWEIVGNFTVNRFLSTRISLNPRYDNTIIYQKGEKAKVQFKEWMSFGFSYKLLR